jgi:ATP phosphoribosyltransferase regulatory subunit
VEVLTRARHELPARAGITAALDALDRLAARAAGAGVEVSVDLAELGGFNYESGVVFAAFAPGSPDAIARGGRYDEVGASFGRARAATGFTMDLRQLAALAPAPARRGAILAPAANDAQLEAEIARLRAAGETVIVDLPGHEPHLHELGCDRRLVKKDSKWHVT